MKNKVIRIIITFVLILILLVDVVQALTMDMGLEYVISNSELKTKIKINNLKIDENKINSISLKLNYDDRILEVKSVENLNGWTSQYTDETNKITAIKLSGTDKDEEICEIKFKIKDKLNNTQIKLTDCIVSDGETEKDISDISVEIIVAGDTHANIVNNVNTNINLTTNTNVNSNKNISTNTNKNTSINTNKNTSININKNTNTNKNVNTNTNKNKNTNTNINTNTNKNILNNKKNNTNNESKVQIYNQSDKLTNADKIPYTGIKTYIRVTMLVILAVAIVVYIKYKKIDKIC